MLVWRELLLSEPALLQLQQAIIAAVAPFFVESASIAAFTADHGDATLDRALVDYVSTFVRDHTGEHFRPHVTTGVAPIAYLESMVLEPFESLALGSP